MKKIFALALVLCMIFALAASAYADFAPTGPVSMIVSYKAGSGTDNTARILAKYAEKYVGQTIVIENVEGASGSQGWSQLAKADPDGMTIGFINLPNFNSNIVNGKGSYQVDSFKAICNHVTETSIDLQTLVEYAKANELVAATNGAKASNHIGAQAFAKSAGFSYIAVPADGTANQLLSLRGAESDFCVVKLADIAGQEAEYRILGAFAEERLPELPDVPTLGELGYYQGWLGSSRCIVAPAGVSDEVIAFYEAAFKQAMEDPDYLAAAEQAGMATDYKDAAGTAALIASQQAFAESLTDDFWAF